ncbi:Scytalidopepsin B [Lachnellula suecica]|uniref:Scytalidopepsin B n=1 Tax=Lachnellula suecica TaxID=602035 RepID=A0A8T9BZQ6_9HELO|nr:Scytalidopepsin B [Lachnellula suecica]
MKFTSALAAAILAHVALATPVGSTRERRHASRSARKLARSQGTVLKTGPMIKSTTESPAADVSYSENWAGAVITSTDVTEVTGIATIPTVTTNDGAAWVGIDGDSCETAILQTGFQWINGEYSAWYEWYPEDSYNFDITIAAGDSIQMTVKATSKTGGTATIENLTTGTSVTETFSGQHSLCEYDAEWIVEDFEECEGSSCSLVPFGDFGTIEFTSATALINGATVDAGTSGEIIDIEQSSVLTSCSTSGTTVTCKYV